MAGSDIAWSHDASNPGFFYARYPEGDDGTATTRVGRQQVCFHKLGTPCSEDEVVFQNPAEPDWIYGVTITEDGRYLLISVRCMDRGSVHWSMRIGPHPWCSRCSHHPLATP